MNEQNIQAMGGLKTAFEWAMAAIAARDEVIVKLMGDLSAAVAANTRLTADIESWKLRYAAAKGPQGKVNRE